MNVEVKMNRRKQTETDSRTNANKWSVGQMQTNGQSNGCKQMDSQTDANKWTVGRMQTNGQSDGESNKVDSQDGAREAANVDRSAA